MRKSNIVVFLILIFSGNYSFSQTTFPLWENEIPGSISSEKYQEQDSIKDNILHSVSHVKIPSLSVFIPKKTSGTAVIICPGGGYSHLAMDKEGIKVAKWLNKLGITAFVLKYRLPNDSIMKNKEIGPLQDAQKALEWVRGNAQKWKIDKNKIGIMGFSAGGHLASTLSTHYTKKVFPSKDSTGIKPDFSILIYPVISMRDSITHKGSRNNLLGKNPSEEKIAEFSNDEQITPETPISFIVQAENDQAVPVMNSIRYFLALKQNDVKAELHIYQDGGHGFGLGNTASNKNWTFDCESWLRANKMIPNLPAK